MEQDENEGLRFPIGRHIPVMSFNRDAVNAWISEIEGFPSRFRAVVDGIRAPELEKRYRPGGWNIRQLAYHLADSHTHILIRFKWALTEDKPLIKAYYEERFAELSDSRSGPIGIALRGLESVHERWVSLMRSMDDADFQKAFLHPETGLENSLFDRAAHYAWHGKHHLEHVKLALSA